ncbi:L-lactate permease [Lutibaculum baratangense]|uniref:L-lactate permease n=1 Tax=Lutibaculum baratangense AMV1 TaxID=631454 RepID=V4QVN7_9HYPH|nr:L-lactate permease [Lutibaculum baratangense]ESR23822.1 L-lactate permease [Lutibaculum baratangense AMV1]
MHALLALAPVLLILGLMVGLRWPAVHAGALGLALTLAVALFGFDYGGGSEGFAPAVGGALAEAVFVAATIAWIIFPALCIYELQLRGGAFDVLKAALLRITDDPRILVLLVAWFFGLFMEGAAGFGTPVALAAPLLVGLGFTPVSAVTLVMIGHAAGVSFGAVGTPILPQMAATGFSGLELSRATGLLHGLLGWILLLFVFAVARRAAPRPASGAGWGVAGAAAGCFLVPYLSIAWFVGPELPTLGGALLGAVAFVALLHVGRADASAGPAAGTPAELWRASLPYLVLLVLVLLTRLVPPLQAATRSVEWTWALEGGFAGSFQPLYHPGTMLFLGFVLGGLLQGRRAAELRAAAGAAAARLPLVLLALVAMLGIARLMVHAGMIGSLAEAAATMFGGAWPALAPSVGVLGTFVTGSATASNILLTDFQVATAERLGLDVLWLAAAQGFGAAVGNIVCPHNVIAGGATVGLQGREGEVLRRTAVACLAYALAGGALVLLIVA